jgi:hypothetical protein
MQVTSPLLPNQTCITPTALAGFTFTMTDGQNNTLTWPLFSPNSVQVSTDASGAITAPWDVIIYSLTNATVSLETINIAGPQCGNTGTAHQRDSSSGFAFFGFNLNSPGVWSSPSPAIEITMLKTQFQLGILPDPGSSFSDQLQVVLNDITYNTGLTCQDLQIFVAHVKAQTGKKLSAAQAASILQTTSQIASQLNCAQ